MIALSRSLKVLVLAARNATEFGRGRRSARSLSNVWRRWTSAGGGTVRKGRASKEAGVGTSVDRYWAKFTVYAEPFRSAQSSLDYLEWRFAQYPLFKELMALYGDHDGEVVLDYGCGPGNDVVGFLVLGRAGKIIGVDISAKALSLAAKRLQLHCVDPFRMELIQISDAHQTLPLADASVDYVYSGGVLHHTSDPEAIVREFHRVLKPKGRACLMVYNRDSIWFHLHAAYIKKVLDGMYAGLTVEEVFARTTDSETCPIARPYRATEFGELVRRAGFEAEFLGGYLSLYELEILRTYRQAAEGDPRLPSEHREFLRALTDDGKGYPVYQGKHAGIGGVYRLCKRS